MLVLRPCFIIPIMDEQHISQLEAQLEKLVEGAFSSLFRKRLNAHDIALQLARSMEVNLHAADDDDPRLIAPDEYVITLNAHMHREIQRHRPDLPQILAQHLVNLAAQSEYRLLNPPLVKLRTDAKLGERAILVNARHSNTHNHSTAVIKPITMRITTPVPRNPQFIINGQRVVDLNKSIINIGRDLDNDIVLDDPYCSRHHVQIRLRFGAYTLFDVQSRGGTRVNDVTVTEHALKSGDVINIGTSQLVYLMDTSPPDTMSLDSPVGDT